MKTLQSLFDGFSAQVSGSLDRPLTDIVFDSRQVRPGALFVALRGAHVDGHHFIDAAVKAGAAAIVAETPASHPEVAWVRVENSLKTLSVIAPRFWEFPSHRLLTVGITGTNGKTTSSYILESVLEAAGYPTAVLGTINYRFRAQSKPAPNTTPFASDLQRFMAEVSAQGAKACVMEVSSHALALGRTEGVDFDAALFTNLTQDHLDFHGTMENYAEAKALLFRHMTLASSKPYPRLAVVNADDPWSERLVKGVQVPVIRYGFLKADYQASDVQSDARGSRFQLAVPGGKSYSLHVPLVGDYNVTNALGAAALALALGLQPEAVMQGVAALRRVPGRMERLECDKPFSVIVDYAHTEDALRKALHSLRRLKPARLLTVFGCGGDRDRTKRPLMGAAAAELSDAVYVTSDNPRSEDPAKIALDVEVGIRRVRNDGYEIILDRETAIRRAVAEAKAGDIILIAGKGHETYQIVGTTRLAFDDRDVARRALAS